MESSSWFLNLGFSSFPEFGRPHETRVSWLPCTVMDLIDLHPEPSVPPILAGSDEERNRLPEPYRSWPELSLTFFDLPVHVTKTDIHRWLSKEGKVVFMSLFDPCNGNAKMAARVIFEPPPGRVFWLGDLERGTLTVQQWEDSLAETEITVSLREQDNLRRNHIPVADDRSCPSKINFCLQSIDFGMMVGPSTMRPLKSARGSDFAVKVELNGKEKKLVVFFPFPIRCGTERTIQQYKLVVDVAQIKKPSTPNRRDVGLS